MILKLTELEINILDKEMKKYGFIYEGSLFRRVWIYRNRYNDVPVISLNIDGGIKCIQVKSMNINTSQEVDSGLIFTDGVASIVDIKSLVSFINITYSSVINRVSCLAEYDDY